MKKKHLIFPICLMLSLSGCVMYNGLPAEDATCEHKYAEEYSFDATKHWHAAICEHTDLKKDVEDHSFGDFKVVQDATLAKEGLKVRTCSVCGYKEEVTIEKLAGGEQGSGDVGGGSETPTWSITDIRFDRTTIELTVGDSPISVVPTIVGEGKFPTSLAVTIANVPVTSTVDGEEVTQNVKIAELSSNVVESGSAFTVKPLLAGSTKITVTSVGKTDVSKDIDVVVQPKVEKHELSLSETDITMNKGSIRVLGCNSTDVVNWESSNDEVVTLENKTNTGAWLKALKSSGDNPITITASICVGTEYQVIKTCTVTVVSTEQTVFDYYYINNQKLTNLHLYMWGENGSNAPWPGVGLGEANYINKDLEEVYKITIDKDVVDYDKMIISGKDSIGDVQTDDIVLSSFVTQNAFTIPSIPTDVLDGVRKASIKMGTFNPAEDVLSGSFITLSMNEASLIVDETVDVICYTNEHTVTYTVISGDNKVELSNETNNGFTVKGLAAGEATIEAKVPSGDDFVTATLHVTVIEDEKITYYFANNYQWTNLKVFMWGNKGTNGDFPGQPFAKAPVKNKDNVDTYEISFNKYKDGYTGLVISGTDEHKGWAKTDDIIIADLESGKDMIYITETGWDRVSMVGTNEIKACSFAMDTFEPFGPRISITETNKEIGVDQTVEIAVDTNSEYEIINSDDTVVEVTKAADKMTVKGLKAGNATITAKVNETVYDSINIEVKEDYTVRYYFVNNYKWTDLKVFMWNDSTQKSNGEYPGVAIGERAFVDMNGNDVYAISFQRYADNYQGFIVSGMDGTRTNRCKTEDILVSGFGDDNGVELNGWRENEDTTLIKYGFYTYELYLNIAISVEFGEGTEIPLNVKTNGQNVSYEITSGADKIELKNTADTGVTIVGKAAGTATFTASVSDGSQTVTKTVTVNVMPDELYTYYFVNEYEWTNVKAYLYVNENTNNHWPGESMTLLGTDERGKEIYSISFRKYSEGYKGMVINGHDIAKAEDAKTSDIIFDQLDTGCDCFTITGWADEGNLIADYFAKPMGNYVLLSDYSLNMNKDESTSLHYVSNGTVSIENSDSTVVQATLTNDSVELTALKAGDATITLTVGTGENAVSKSCVISVTEYIPDYVTYYFANNYVWSNLYLYLWNDAEVNNASFPGVPIDFAPIKNSYGNDTYAITFDKNEYDWTHCIITGYDNYHQTCKTQNIDFASLDAEGKNMIRISQDTWGEENFDGSMYVCSYCKEVFAEFVPDVSLSSDAVTVNVGKTTQITVNANDSYEVFCSDDTVCEVNSNDNKINIKGLKEGDATIGVTICKGTENEKTVYCTVTVDVEIIPVPTTYSITNIPDGYDADGAVFYVWIFGGEVEGNGQWVAATLSGNTVTFTTDVEFESAVLVRMDPNASEVPSWDAKWNKTNDLTFDSNHTAAVIEAWN
ncbi:MAG: Ig-like domain-containing protein [Bacilli bacterium]|nr:Ig-like domain-containing protein [Bacilli bacterium]